MSIHKGVTYGFNQYQNNATQQGDLKRHIMAIYKSNP